MSPGAGVALLVSALAFAVVATYEAMLGGSAMAAGLAGWISGLSTLAAGLELDVSSRPPSAHEDDDEWNALLERGR